MQMTAWKDSVLDATIGVSFSSRDLVDAFSLWLLHLRKNHHKRLSVSAFDCGVEQPGSLAGS